jgi:MSHA pilin protein MshC
VSRAIGFSLVELVVVMVIAGILAAIAIPRLADSETEGSWYQEQAKAGVRYAQRQAVAQRRLVYVDVAPTQIKLCYVPACSPANNVLNRITDGQAYILPAPTGTTITVVSGTVPLSFNGLGQPSGAVQLSIGGKLITVNSETGYVQ